MKYLINVVAFLTFSTCAKQDLTNILYFSFDNTAKQWFSELKVNDTLKFKSNVGNVRTYWVTEITTAKKQARDCNFKTGSCKFTLTSTKELFILPE